MMRTTMMALAAVALGGYAQETLQVTVRADTPAHEIPKTLYGIFFEDINYAADGGLYPELIANRGFDWRKAEPEGWTREWRGEAMGRVSLQGGWPVHPNTFQYVRVECYAPGDGAGIANSGFGGIAVKQGAHYDLSFYARRHADYDGGLTVRLETPDRQALAAYRIERGAWTNRPRKDGAAASASPLDPPPPPEWAKYTAVFAPSATVTDARLVILLDAEGTVDLEQVSLFPRDTYNGRPNGLRPDLVEMLKDMKPATLRFPGGCVVEGGDFETMYWWKRTVGPLERRALNVNRWGYWQTHGLGFYEYFCLAEDIGAEPLPILAAGLSCQFAKPEAVPAHALQPFIQNALDLIEFANGAPDTPWGRVRAEMGHPAPFDLKYLGIGNENWDHVFLDRYAVIAKAVKAAHPEIKIIGSAGAAPEGDLFNLGWKRSAELKADLVDEHFYKPPDWFFSQSGRYDAYDRSGPKVYVGEYACHTPDRKNNLLAALAEAAAMTGFERNSDVVETTAYAPLFNKVGNTQWDIDLIWFDNTRVFGTPSYYVQKLFMTHLPDVLLPAETAGRTEAALPPTGTIGLHTWNTAAEFKDIAVSKGGETLYRFDPVKKLEDWSPARKGVWRVEGDALAQTDAGVTDTAISYKPGINWSDYTLELKARKLSGKEGFIIRFRDQRQQTLHINLGGWNNTEHGIEHGLEKIPRIPGAIETGRWYAVKVRLDGARVRIWLDGAPLFDTVIRNKPVKSAYVVAGLDRKAGEIVVKAVNPAGQPLPVALKLAGAKVAAQQARRITLSGGLDDTNTLDAPLRVAPKEDTVAIAGADASLTLAPHSFTVLRIETR